MFMLSILAIFSLWYQGKVVPIGQENNDLLPLNFGRDFQLPNGGHGIPLALATIDEQNPPRPELARRRSHCIVQRVPVPRLNRTHRNHNRPTKSTSRSWNPGLPINNQFIGQIVQELHQIQQDDSHNNITLQNNRLNHSLQGTMSLVETYPDPPL